VVNEITPVSLDEAKGPPPQYPVIPEIANIASNISKSQMILELVRFKPKF